MNEATTTLTRAATHGVHLRKDRGSCSPFSARPNVMQATITPSAHCVNSSNKNKVLLLRLGLSY